MRGRTVGAAWDVIAFQPNPPTTPRVPYLCHPIVCSIFAASLNYVNVNVNERSSLLILPPPPTMVKKEGPALNKAPALREGPGRWALLQVLVKIARPCNGNKCKMNLPSWILHSVPASLAATAFRNNLKVTFWSLFELSYHSVNRLGWSKSVPRGKIMPIKTFSWVSSYICYSIVTCK